MKNQIENIVDDYQTEKIDRRGFLNRMIALTGTYAAAHLLLEQTGLAQTVVSDKESKKANVDSSTVSYKNGDANLSGYLSKPMKKANIRRSSSFTKIAG